MDPDARDFAAFAATHAKTIGAIYRRARAEVGFDLDRVAFSSRLHAIAESVLAEDRGGRRQVDRLLAAIESADLYLATAAAAGNREALTRLHRWYGPLLRELGEAAGRPDLEDELIGGSEAPPPLASYLGLGSLRRWLLACAARVLAPPRPGERLGEDGPHDPEARRAADLGPVRALAALPPELRFAVALQLAGGLMQGAAPAIAGISARRHAAAYERLLALTERETDRKLVALGEDRRRRAWTELHRALGVTGRRGVLAALAHDAALREMVAPTADCPDPNFLLGALDRVTGVARDEVLEHAARCWPCLHAARSLGPPQRRAGSRRLQLALACALVAAVAVLAWSRIGRDPAAASVAAVAEPAALPAATGPAAEPPTQAASSPGDLGPMRSEAALLPTRASAAATPLPASAPPGRPAIRATTPPPETGRAAVATPAHVLARVPPLTVPPTVPLPRPATPPPATPGAGTAPPRATPTPAPSGPAAATPPPAVPVARAAAPPMPALRRAAGASRAARVVNVAVERYEPGLEARALAMISRAIEIDPDLAVAHFDAAVLLERSGEDRRALSHWARYLHLAGGSEDTTLARDRLGR